MHKILKILSPAMVTLALMSSLPHVALAADSTPTNDSEAIASEEQIKIAALNNGEIEAHDTFESAAKSLKLSASEKTTIGKHVQEAKANGAPVVYIEPQTLNGFQTYVVSYNQQDGTGKHYMVYKEAEKREDAQTYINSIASGKKGAERMKKLDEKYKETTNKQREELDGIMAKAKANMTRSEFAELNKKIDTLTALDKRTRESAQEVLKSKFQVSSPIPSRTLPTVGGAGVSDSGGKGSNKFRRERGDHKPSDGRKWRKRGDHKLSEKQKSEHTKEERSVLHKLNDGLLGKRPNAKKDLTQARRQSDKESAIAQDE